MADEEGGGQEAAVARGEIEYVFSENVANADYERVMRGYAEKGHTLIVGESFAVEAAARKVAKDYPKVSFLMGSSGKPQAPNFSVFDNYIQEPAYLSGLIAGSMSRSNKIGMVGGFPIPEVNRLMNAFMAGAKEVNPKVEFMVTFINSWFDPPKAKEAAFAMIDKGADVMYAERFGVSDAAKERKVLAIGNVINTQDKYPDTVVASSVNKQQGLWVGFSIDKDPYWLQADSSRVAAITWSTLLLWGGIAVLASIFGSALIARIHHCIGDGIALISVMLSITDGEAHFVANVAPVDPAQAGVHDGPQGARPTSDEQEHLAVDERVDGEGHGAVGLDRVR